MKESFRSKRLHSYLQRNYQRHRLKYSMYLTSITEIMTYRPFLYPATQNVAGYYVIPSELWVSVRPSVRRPSVRPPVCPSVNASFPCSSFSTFWPIFFKLCIDIGVGEEWYGIASRLISFWNNRVMALDVCQKCFVLRFRALTLVPFCRFSSNFA